MLTSAQSSRLPGCHRIVRHVETDALIGVALEVSVAVGRAERLWLHGDPRQPLCFAVKTGKIVGMPWVSREATDEEVAAALAELGG